MEKASPRKNKTPAGGYKVLGTTSDGVRILRSKIRATHFTDKEMRDAIAAVLQARESRSDSKKG